MQITEQIIQRIARQVFNQMFPSSLRQSGAIISGSGGSVQYAVEAGHAASADSASYASSAGSATNATSATYASYITNGGDMAAISGTTVFDSGLRLYRVYNNGYPTTYGNLLRIGGAGLGEMLFGWTAEATTGPLLYRSKRDVQSTEWGAWVTILTSSNSSVSKSGSTLSVKINGSTESLTDTWRGIQNNLISDSTTDSLSANQGKVLKGYTDTLFGYFDGSGNAKSALKLTTVSKTAWGQTYWTSGGVPDSISGDMSSVGDISFSASGKKIGGFLYFDTTNNRLGVGVSSPSYRLQVDGQIYTNNSIHVVNSAASVHVGSSTSNRISLHWSSGNTRGLYDYTDAWLIGTDGTNTFLNKGNVGIGTESPSYKLHVDGTIYATGSITERSDLNDKNVETYAWAPALSAIADAPIAIYTMKDDPEQRRRVGSIAQYWQKAMPEATYEAHDGTLSMNYGEISLVSVIALAREVRNLKAQIEMLKRR